VGSIDEGFGEIKLPALNEVVGKCLQDVLEHAVLHPALEAPKASRVRWIPIRHVGPWCARPQDPEDAVEHIARISPRSTASVFAYLRLGKKLFDCCPLPIGEVHLDLRSQTGLEVDPGSETI